MIPKESRNELALDTFIKAHPELIEEMKELSAEDRQQQILWAFEDEAESRGLEAWELALELIARWHKSPPDRHLWMHCGFPPEPGPCPSGAGSARHGCATAAG